MGLVWLQLCVAQHLADGYSWKTMCVNLTAGLKCMDVWCINVKSIMETCCDWNSAIDDTVCDDIVQSYLLKQPSSARVWTQQLLYAVHANTHTHHPSLLHNVISAGGTRRSLRAEL